MVSFCIIIFLNSAAHRDCSSSALTFNFRKILGVQSKELLPGPKNAYIASLMKCSSAGNLSDCLNSSPCKTAQFQFHRIDNLDKTSAHLLSSAHCLDHLLQFFRSHSKGVIRPRQALIK